MTALSLSGDSGIPPFDPWRATERLREARDTAQKVADTMPVPVRGLEEYIDYCDERIAAAFYPTRLP